MKEKKIDEGENNNNIGQVLKKALTTSQFKSDEINSPTREENNEEKKRANDI
jgi:hypothetical protein